MSHYKEKRDNLPDDAVNREWVKTTNVFVLIYVHPWLMANMTVNVDIRNDLSHKTKKTQNYTCYNN